MATWSTIPPFNGGNDDAFIAQFSSSGNLIWNTFVGGNSEWDCTDYGHNCDIAVNGDGDAYVVGTNTASWGSPVYPFSANQDLFIAKVINVPVIDSISTDDPSPSLPPAWALLSSSLRMSQVWIWLDLSSTTSRSRPLEALVANLLLA